MSVSP